MYVVLAGVGFLGGCTKQRIYLKSTSRTDRCKYSPSWRSNEEGEATDTQTNTRETLLLIHRYFVEETFRILFFYFVLFLHHILRTYFEVSCIYAVGENGGGNEAPERGRSAEYETTPLYVTCMCDLPGGVPFLVPVRVTFTFCGDLRSYPQLDTRIIIMVGILSCDVGICFCAALTLSQVYNTTAVSSAPTVCHQSRRHRS